MNIKVTETAANIRGIARSALANNWKGVCVGMILYMIILSFVSDLLMDLFPNFINNPLLSEPVSIPFISYLYLIIIGGPITFGVTSFIMHFFRRKDINPGYIFNGFGNFFKSFGLEFMTGILCGWPLVLTYAILILFLSLSVGGNSSPIVMGGVGMIFFILLGFAIAYMIIFIYAYSQAFYLMCSDSMMEDNSSKRGIIQCLKESRILMRGNKWKLFCIGLSYIGWLILGTLPMIIVISILEGLGENQIVITIVGFIAELPMAAYYAYYETGMMAFHDILVGKLVAKPSQQFLD